MNQESANLYAILGVRRRSTPDEIETAYASWQQRLQSGDIPRDPPWEEQLKYAYEVLSNPRRRSFYDSLLAEAGTSDLRLEVLLSAERLLLLNEPQLLYTLVSIAARDGQADDQRPLNLALVVDRSTSMRGARLERVLAAAELLLDKLAPGDALSVVSFSDRAEVVLPAAVKGDAHRADSDTAAVWREARSRLRSVVAGGGTEIYQGLQAGLSQARTHAGVDHVSQIILLTDGHTYGDAADCLQLAARAAAEGIGITAFGIGADWNDEFLDALVAPSGGRSGFIESPADILPQLEERLVGLGSILARRLALRTGWPSQLTLHDGFKLTPFAQPLAIGDSPIPLGDLEGRAPLSFLLVFLVAPHTIPARLTIPIEVEFGQGDTGGLETSAIGELKDRRQVLILTTDELDNNPPPPVIVEAARRLTLYRMQERAWQDTQSGKLDTAAALMRRLSARYGETGSLRLSQQAALEAGRLAGGGTMSLEGRKVLRYGTRSLFTRSESHATEHDTG